jgi:hypothetical protein
VRTGNARTANNNQTFYPLTALARLPARTHRCGSGGRHINGKWPNIIIVLDDNFAPFTVRVEDHKVPGILVDRWLLWQAQTGIDDNLLFLITQASDKS